MAEPRTAESLWTRSFCLDPDLRGSDEFIVGDRRKRASRAIAASSWLECPQDERFGRVMFEQTGAVQIVIPCAIRQRFTEISTGQNLLVQILPFHRQRRQVPIVPSGNSGGVSIGFLVTGSAIQSRHPFAFRTTNNIEQV